MTKLYHAIQLPLSKVCITCDQDKPLDDFTPLIDGKYGRVAHCKSCMATKVREKRAAKRPPQPIPQPGYKFCMKCGEEKPLEAFEPQRNQCKACRQNYRKERYHKQKGTIEYKEYRKWYQSTPTFKENNRERTRRNYDIQSSTPEGREQRNAASRRHNKTPKRQEFDRKRRENPKHKAYLSGYCSRPEVKQRINQKNRERYASDPEYRMAVAARNWLRRIRKIDTSAGMVDFARILGRDGYHCYICNQSILPHQRMSFDHRVPLNPRPSEPQGTHTEENIFVTHLTCNARKRNKPFEALTAWDRRGPNA